MTPTGHILLRGRKVGDLVGGTYVTYRKPHHWYVKYQGFGISEDVLQLLRVLEAHCIKVVYYADPNYHFFIKTVDEMFTQPVVQEGDNDAQRIFWLGGEDRETVLRTLRKYQGDIRRWGPGLP